MVNVLLGSVLSAALLVGVPSTLAGIEKNANQLRPVAPSADQICPIRVNSPIPQLTLKKIDGSSFDLNAAIRTKPSILIFYRGGW